MIGRIPAGLGGGNAPGRIFLDQLEATSAQIAQRRQEVRALVAQLTAFEQQLAAFEGALRPVIEWSSAWVRAQEQAMNPFGLFGPDDPSAKKPPGP